MANAEQIAVVLKVLMDAFPERQLSEGAITIYVDALLDVPFDVLKKAAVACIQSSPWFPKVADLRRQALKIARVPHFNPEDDDPGLSLRLRLYKLQRDFANGEPLDEDAWLKLIEDCELYGFTESAEDNARRLAHYREYLAAHPDPDPDLDEDLDAGPDEQLNPALFP